MRIRSAIKVEERRAIRGSGHKERAAGRKNIAEDREDIAADRENIGADREDIAADEDDMQQPQTRKRRTKLNVGETYQTQTRRKMGLNERKSRQSKIPMNNPTRRYNFRAKSR